MPRRGPILEITDGTIQNTINLIHPGKGYHLCDWSPSRPDIEYQTNKNWFSGHETPASMALKPTVESFTFTANRKSQDDLIELEAKFNRILIMAARFWTGDRNIKRPFYIRAKAKDETYERYTTISATKLHGSGNPFASPFSSRKPAEQDLTVVIVHNGWRDAPPGEAFDITGNLGNEMYSPIHEAVFGVSDWSHLGFAGYEKPPTKTYEVILANYLSYRNISHIFHGAQPQNMQDWENVTEYPVVIYDPGYGYAYFGSVDDTSFNHEYQIFTNLVFNLEDTAPMTAAYWEYLDGTIWKPLQNVRGGADHLQRSGMVLWDIPLENWYEGEVHSLTGYWVRMSTVDFFISQSGYPVYSAAMPYMDVRNETPADNGFSLDFSLVTVPGIYLDDIGSLLPHPNRFIIGAREINGIDENFLSYFSPGLNGSHAGIYFEPGTRAVIEEDYLSYCNRVLKEDFPPVYLPSSILDMGSMSIDAGAAAASIGKFRVFARMRSVGGRIERGELDFWLDVSDSGGESEFVTVSTKRVSDVFNDDAITVLDLGSLTLGVHTQAGFGNVHGAIEQIVHMKYRLNENPSPASGLILYDLVFIPQDMWFADISASRGLATGDDELIVSSATAPSQMVSYIRDATNHDVRQSTLVTPGLPVSFFTNNGVRFYITMLDDTLASGSSLESHRARLETSFQYFVSNGFMQQTNNFLSARGRQGFVPE
ncbi:MAG: hypothetical protein DRI46_09415 [Chloroflexi bacterium]|nr:MAG: hypothetical protein DRI46_09415 [Chloroflexota bacterium]